MRRVGNIMADLGFNENAPEGVKKAFMKNLIKAAYGTDVEIQIETSSKEVVESIENHRSKKTAFVDTIVKDDVVGEQLSFDFFKKAR